LPQRRIQSTETPADLPPEKAYTVLRAQLAKLQELKDRNYQEANAAENEWFNLTAKLVLRSFGSGSPNYSAFRAGRSAGEHQMARYGSGTPHAQNQRNFGARLQAFEGILRSCISELELDLPSREIKGVYEVGEEYEFYCDVKTCLSIAQREIFVLDPYLNAEIFDVYAAAIARTVRFRLLTINVQVDVRNLAQKYVAGGNFEFRRSDSIHDRVLFADNRVWLIGQSLKDAAKKKPTYIVEHDEPLMRGVYENIWHAASVII
jgi:hypothetical protein